MDVEGGWRGRSVKKPSVGWKTEERLFISEKLRKMMKGIVDLISRGSIRQSEPAKQMLWSTAGYLETTQTFISGRWRPTTFRRSPRPVSWLWQPQTGRSRVKQPSHHVRTIWTSAMMSCVRALTSRSVKHHFWTPEKVVFIWDVLKKNPRQTSSCCSSSPSYLLLSRYIQSLTRVALSSVISQHLRSILSFRSRCSSFGQHFLTVVASCSHMCSANWGFLSFMRQYLYQCISLIYSTERGPDKQGPAWPGASDQV